MKGRPFPSLLPQTCPGQSFFLRLLVCRLQALGPRGAPIWGGGERTAPGPSVSHRTPGRTRCAPRMQASSRRGAAWDTSLQADTPRKPPAGTWGGAFSLHFPQRATPRATQPGGSGRRAAGPEGGQGGQVGPAAGAAGAWSVQGQERAPQDEQGAGKWGAALPAPRAPQRVGSGSRDEPLGSRQGPRALTVTAGGGRAASPLPSGDLCQECARRRRCARVVAGLLWAPAATGGASGNHAPVTPTLHFPPAGGRGGGVGTAAASVCGEPPTWHPDSPRRAPPAAGGRHHVGRGARWALPGAGQRKA